MVELFGRYLNSDSLMIHQLEGLAKEIVKYLPRLLRS